MVLNPFNLMFNTKHFMSKMIKNFLKLKFVIVFYILIILLLETGETRKMKKVYEF
jgi:hypothetical protein